MRSLSFLQNSKSFSLSRRLPASTLSWALLYLIIAGIGLRDYISLTSPIFLLGVFTLVQVSVSDPQESRSFRFAYLVLAFGVLSLFLPVKTLLYLSCSSALLFLLETAYRKITPAAVLTIIIMSPVFEYASTVFGFPIRLQLTDWAGRLLALTDQHIISQGNTLTLNGNEFSVDAECMGLYMMQTSLLLGILISSFYQRTLKKSLQLHFQLLILSLIFLLNVVSNLFRIIILVQFNILPGTVMHEMIGLACLVLYVIIPGAALIKILINYSARDNSQFTQKVTQMHSPKKVARLCIFLAFALAFTSINISRRNLIGHATAIDSPAISGYVVERVDNDILKLKTAHSLVYIKNIQSFYATEHNPMICWKGSGYDLKKVQSTVMQRNSVYTAVLIKGEEKLYTAWWYDNSKRRTISQLSWRLDMLRGADNYSLVNVTCSSESDLLRSASTIFSDRHFFEFLSNIETQNHSPGN